MKKLILAVLIVVFADGASAQSGPFPDIPKPVPFPAELKTPQFVDGVISANMQVVIKWASGEREFTVMWRERSPSAASTTFWTKNETTISTTHRLTDIAYRAGGNEIYASGIRDSGRGVIEKFTFQPRQNGLEVKTVPVVVEPIGTSTVDHSCEVVLNGASWSPPESWQSYGSPVRSQVMGDQVGVVRSFDVDPYGRYMLVLAHETSKLYLVDMTVTPKTLELIGDPAVVPQLAQMENIVMLTMESGGHMALLHRFLASGELIVEGSGEEDQVVLLDVTNDAQFETVMAVPDGTEGLEAAGLGYYDTADPWVANDIQEPAGGW